MKKKGLNKAYLLVCIFYTVYYITLGVFYPYANLYYERLGFSGSQIGLMTSLGMIAAMLITPLWGILSDKFKNPRAVIAFLLAMAGVSSLIWSMQKAFVPVLILSVIFAVFRQNTSSLIDAFGVQVCDEQNKDFGFARSMGSLGYLLGSFVIANLLFAFGCSGPYMQVYVFCSFVGSVMILFIPHRHQMESSKSNEKLSVHLVELLKNRDYLFILMMMLLTIMVMDTVMNYAGNHLIYTLHQSDSMIGIASFAQVFPEILILMVANRIFSKMKTSQIFMVGALAQIVRFTLCASSSSIVVFLAATALNGVSIAVCSVAYVSYIYQKVNPNVLNSAMAIYATVYTIGSAILNQVFGFVYQYGTSYHLFWISAFTAMIAFVLVLLNCRLDQ
ncbi:MAG: MFS transporter [Erysipelotrichaceae bacterium]|nr:MFS transporter [Erysipelotrichaceae bacterium]